VKGEKGISEVAQRHPFNSASMRAFAAGG
jgi:hypothetical protein